MQLALEVVQKTFGRSFDGKRLGGCIDGGLDHEELSTRLTHATPILDPQLQNLSPDPGPRSRSTWSAGVSPSRQASHQTSGCIAA